MNIGNIGMTFDVIICSIVLMLAGTLALSACLAARPRASFVVKVRRGSANLVKGEVSTTFLRHLRQIITRHAIGRGTCSGYVEGRLVRLQFSSEFGARSRQQIRNWMAAYSGSVVYTLPDVTRFNRHLSPLRPGTWPSVDEGYAGLFSIADGHHIHKSRTSKARLRLAPQIEPDENGPSIPYVFAAVFSSPRQYRSKKSLPCSGVT